jgi:hypothetical protein
VIKNNRFIHIKNRERCLLLHSIYVAHDSTKNVIEGNIFEDSCGDAIRFRDGSSANLVKDNIFIDAWDKAPVSDWYCDRDRRDDCTKATGECPSIMSSANKRLLDFKRSNLRFHVVIYHKVPPVKQVQYVAHSNHF